MLHFRFQSFVNDIPCKINICSLKIDLNRTTAGYEVFKKYDTFPEQPLSLWLLSGCGVVHSPFRTYRPSGQDRSLHLFLPEKRRGPAALCRKQSCTFNFCWIPRLFQSKRRLSCGVIDSTWTLLNGCIKLWNWTVVPGHHIQTCRCSHCQWYHQIIKQRCCQVLLNSKNWLLAPTYYPCSFQ